MKVTALFVYVCAAAIGLAAILGAAIVDGPLWAKAFVALIGVVMCPFLILLGRAYSKAAQPTAAPLSPQQVMRNTRNALPDEYREWFDWTAQMAGFSKPPQRSKIVVDASRDRTELYAIGTGELVDVAYHDEPSHCQHPGTIQCRTTEGVNYKLCVHCGIKFEPPKKLPTVYRTCPDNTCNTTYGPGAGWTHTDQHTWVEMQT